MDKHFLLLERATSKHLHRVSFTASITFFTVSFIGSQHFYGIPQQVRKSEFADVLSSPTVARWETRILVSSKVSIYWMATKWLRILSLDGNGKSRNHLVAEHNITTWNIYERTEKRGCWTIESFHGGRLFGQVHAYNPINCSCKLERRTHSRINPICQSL